MVTGLRSRRRRYLTYKIWALLSLVRWYSVLLIAITLYLSALFLFNHGLPRLEVLMRPGLHAEIFALCLFIMSGFIINAFYDLEKDLINRPHKTYMDKHISRRFSLNCYFAFNTLAAIISLCVGWQVFLVNVLFSVVLWAYSHKIQKKRFFGEMGAALLTVAPFFSMAVFYDNVTWKMLEFVALIFIVLIEREVLKKVLGLKGDFVLGNRSIPIEFGEKTSNDAVVILSAISIAQLLFFMRFVNPGSPAILAYLMIFLQGATIMSIYFKKDHNTADRLLKLLIILMVFSIPFI